MGRESGFMLIRKKRKKPKNVRNTFIFHSVITGYFPVNSQTQISCPYRAHFLKIPAFLTLQHFVSKRKKETSNKCKIQPGLLNIFKPAHNIVLRWSKFWTKCFMSSWSTAVSQSVSVPLSTRALQKPQGWVDGKMRHQV